MTDGTLLLEITIKSLCCCLRYILLCDHVLHRCIVLSFSNSFVNANI